MISIPLAGIWTLHRIDEAMPPVPANVPGDVHSALIAARVIPEPYAERNEDRVQWVGLADWRYERVIEVSSEALAREAVTLVCDALDTFAAVTINGHAIGEADNAFRGWAWDVKRHLVAGRNTVAITIRSAQKEAARRAKQLPYPVPWTSVCCRIPHINLVRKVQCHAGWDWGIALMVAGIPRDLRLECHDLARLPYVYTTQHHRDGAVDVEVAVEALSPTGGAGELTVTLGESRSVVAVTLTAGANLLRARVTVADPRIWWPAGQGEQPLYPLVVTLGDRAGRSVSVRKRLGLRRLEIVNQPDAAGVPLTFRVNGRDIFCKGANWIPCDALPERQTGAVIDHLLSSAVSAHMNMIRVWGGGQYEDDAFYDLCDEKGLLVWHDHMFACSLYPADDAFLASVGEEVAHQVKRLRDHASIALWCGDNECIGALGWWKESKDNRDKYLCDYDRLNHGTIRRAVVAADPGRMYWPSSPCAGPGDFSNTFKDDTRGDMHYWDVWHHGRSFDAYRTVKPRFCSEFGFQSFPSLETVQTFADPSQWNLTSPVMEHHQRNAGGNRLINEMFARYFRLPDGFANQLWLSQLQQALAIKIGVEHWRHLRPHCMGALYWQLNDNWPVASWSSIEYGGKWKQLHHHARRFFAPAIATIVEGDGRHDLWVVNDGPAADAELRVRSVGLDGRVHADERTRLRLPERGAALAIERATEAWTQGEPERRFLLTELLVGGEIVHRNEHVFAEWKKLELPEARVDLRVHGLSVELRSNLPVFYATVDAVGIPGEFCDNSVMLMPGEARTLRFTPRGGVTVDTTVFERSLSVNHLRRTYASRPAIALQQPARAPERPASPSAT
ncbi:MAG: glycoside hydrolase family 2 protein [Planctomycetes bacterium]|nr:glycoside hydrolase family 2 protein [Planctomycetota bacterium]